MMRKAISMTVTLSILGLSIFLGSCSQKVQQESILAEFDDQVVTVEELEKEISELSEWQQRKYEGQEGRSEYLTLMAESRMLLEVALGKKLDKDQEIIRQMRDYRDQLLVKELVKREVDNKVKVADGDLRKYYEEHKAGYVEPEKVAITEITVKEEEKAKGIVEEIKGGADFTELAKETNAKGESFGPGQGREGKPGPFSRDKYTSAPEFVNAAFDLEVGKVSDVIVQPMANKLLFSVDLETQSDLESGKLPEVLEQEFENNGTTLSQNAAVMAGARSNRWLINDPDGENAGWYVVEKDTRGDNNKLNIYDANVFYMVIRVDERIPSRQQDLTDTDVESKIRRLLEKQQKKERMDEWLEIMKAEKKFQLYPDRIPKVVEAEEEKAEEAAGTTDEQ